MMRLAGWERRLSDYVEQCRSLPFSWGTHDCATFCAGAAQAVTGEDLLEQFRGMYADEESAVAVVAEWAEGDYEKLITSILGEPKAVNFANRGDVVLSLRYRLPTIGVCLGERSAFVTKKGLTFAQTSDCEKAWAV